MAKALFGHVGVAPDRRLLDEVTRLRARVKAQEFEVARLRAENDRLAAAAGADDLLRMAELSVLLSSLVVGWGVPEFSFLWGVVLRPP